MKKRGRTVYRKYLKSSCEICLFNKSAALDVHHIIPQSEPECTHTPDNLATLCGTCHRLVHSGEIIIEGWFLTSSGLRLFWHNAGEDYKIKPGIVLSGRQHG